MTLISHGIVRVVDTGKKVLVSVAERWFMMPNSKHRIDCRCMDCKLLRVVYALTVASNHGDLEPGDMEWALLILSHSNNLEKL